MSYARPLETGTYIYSDGEYIHFNLDTVSENDIDIFLYQLYSKRRKEFRQRLKHGKTLIKENKIKNEEDLI